MYLVALRCDVGDRARIHAHRINRTCHTRLRNRLVELEDDDMTRASSARLDGDLLIDRLRRIDGEAERAGAAVHFARIGANQSEATAAGATHAGNECQRAERLHEILAVLCCCGDRRCRGWALSGGFEFGFSIFSNADSDPEG